jgi:hypothetical protein
MNLIVIDDDGASFVEPITITGTTMSKCEEERAGLSS